MTGRPDFAARCDPAEQCITCGDVGVPMLIVRIDTATGLALCQDGTGSPPSTVEIGLVEPVGVGDTVLVHAGVALARLEEQAA
jgi:hydrogenase maturation factor